MSSDLHMRLLPQANGRGDFAVTDTIAEFAKELHVAAEEFLTDCS